MTANHVDGLFPRPGEGVGLCYAVTTAGIAVLPAADGPFIHPNGRRAHETFFVAQSRPAPEAVTSARAAVQPTGAPAVRAFLRHRSTRVPFLRQAGFVALAARQPAQTGSAQILRSMSPNSRRVRCPSASRRQEYRARPVGRLLEVGLEPMQGRCQCRTPVAELWRPEETKGLVHRHTHCVVEIFVAREPAVDRLPQEIPPG